MRNWFENSKLDSLSRPWFENSKFDHLLELASWCSYSREAHRTLRSLIAELKHLISQVK